MTHNIYLFDIDGVLVKPRGYRESVKATLQYFYRQMDLLDKMPADDMPVLFESIGITSEWDMIPLCLAMVFDTFLRKNDGEGEIFSEYSQMFEQIRKNSKSRPKIDYDAYIRMISKDVL